MVKEAWLTQNLASFTTILQQTKINIRKTPGRQNLTESAPIQGPSTWGEMVLGA